MLAPAHAEEPASKRCHPTTQICFERAATIAGTSLPLIGIGLFTYWGFEVYNLAYFAAPDRTSPETALAPVPKRLVLHYLREFTVADFQKSGRTVISDNPKINQALVQSGLKQIDALYRPIAPGDRYELNFIPGVGTELAWNGQLLGTITGSQEEIDEFQRAYFGIWLSEYSIKESLREQAFGRRN
jgi:hypothetical protein